MSASGGTVIMDMSSEVKYSVGNSTVNENNESEMTEELSLIAEVTAAPSETVPVTVDHPLQESATEHTGGHENSNDTEQAGKKGRRVTFGEGENIVSGFMAPPSPWNDVKSCSTEDLIAAYHASCDKQSIRPIPRLLQQLHAINNFCDRNDTLSLRGERLDGRHCETLEEILRRVQFRTIDLEATHLEEEGAIALFDMIEYYESCLRLNISYNRSIGPRGWHACSRMIKKTPCLEHLEARHCTISEQVMPMLGRSLRLGSSLTTLHLENSILSGRPLMILVAAIKLNDTLRELFLADNKLLPTDGIQLGNLLKVNHRLHVLDTRNNHLQDVGVSHICDGLYEQNQGTGLTTLVLWNNQITYQAMHNLSRSLCSTQSIETLNLGHNNITNEGIHRLKEGLLHNKSLQRIGLQAAKVSCEGAVALAEYIAESKSLVRLDLRENEIKTGGLMAISLALKVCRTVSRVDLDKDAKKESGVKDYAEQQRRLLQDISNYTQRNRDAARIQEEEEKAAREKAEQEAAANNAITEQQEQEKQQQSAENIKEKKDQENDQHQQQLRFHLNLPLLSRSQELESPAFVREEDLLIVSPPEEMPEPAEEESEKMEKDVEDLISNQVIPGDFPPSPMVSNNGSPLLAHIPEVPPAAPSSPQGGGGLPAPTKPKVSTSPNTARKFIISRVKENPVVNAARTSCKVSDAASPESGDDDVFPAEINKSSTSPSLDSSGSTAQSEVTIPVPQIVSEGAKGTEQKELVHSESGSESSSAMDTDDVFVASAAESGEEGGGEKGGGEAVVEASKNKTESQEDNNTGSDNGEESCKKSCESDEKAEEKSESLGKSGEESGEIQTECEDSGGEPVSVNGICLELSQAMQDIPETSPRKQQEKDGEEPGKALSSADDFEKELDEMLAGVILPSE